MEEACQSNLIPTEMLWEDVKLAARARKDSYISHMKEFCEISGQNNFIKLMSETCG